jgi:cation diffusion facilitator CzcD-associated flavoprotein CzcO
VGDGGAAEIVVIGAGPAGLAVAATLRQRGLSCAVLERAASVGSSWQGRYDQLHLHTIRWLSGLPGGRIPRRFGRWVSRDDFVRYLNGYAQQFDVRPEFGIEVTRIDLGTNGWRLTTSAGTRDAWAVVVATGFNLVPHLPAWTGRDSFTGKLLHSADYREPTAYRGRRVLVVGAGNSAAEIAVQLADTGATVTQSVRTPPNIVRRDTLGIPSQLFSIALKHAPAPVMNSVVGLLRKASVPNLTGYGLPAPAGDGFSQFLRTATVPILDHGFVDRVRAGRITIVPAVDHFDGDRVVLADASDLRPDVVIAATGFRPGVADMVGHLGAIDDRGVPRVHGPESLPGLPRLHFVGIEVTLSGLLHEIGLQARAVGRSLEAPPTAT